MRNLKLILLFILFGMSYSLSGQIHICGEDSSYFPIDKEIVRLRDSLRASGVDTILIYSHWIGRNGFNGYGKVLWQQKGRNTQLRIGYGEKLTKTRQSDSTNISENPALHFFFEHALDTLHINPQNQSVYISHDGSHFIQIVWGDHLYCFTVSNLKVQFNPDHPRSQWINMLKEAGTDILSIEKSRTTAPLPTTSKTGNKKRKRRCKDR